MTAPTPPHASPDGEMIYGKCYASYVQSVSDRDGDPDPYPDVTLLNGTAKFEAVFDGVSARGALTLPAVPRSKGIVVSGDTYEIVNSNLVDKEGREGVWLVASVDEVPITWRITVTLVNERNQTVLNSPYIVTEGLWAEEPDGSLWVNLPDLIPDPGALTPVEGSALRTAQKTLDEIRVLKDLIDTSQIDAANSAQSALTSRNEAEGFRNTAFSKAGEASDSAEAASASERSASDSEERISIEHEHVHQDVNHVDDAAAQVAAAIRQANVFSQDQVPPYLQDEELKRTYGTKAELGEVATQPDFAAQFAQESHYSNLTATRRTDGTVDVRCESSDGSRFVNYNARDNGRYVIVGEVHASGDETFLPRGYRFSDLTTTGVWNSTSTPFTKEIGATWSRTVTTLDAAEVSLYHYTDNRGGVWRVTVAEDPSITVDVSTWMEVAQSKTSPLFNLPAAGTWTITGEHLGADPEHPASDGYPRGWLLKDDYESLIVSNVGVGVEEVKLSSISNKDFALQMKPAGSTGDFEFVPYHGTASEVFASPVVYLSEGKVIEPSSWVVGDPVELAEFEWLQHIYGRNETAPDPTQNIVEVWTRQRISKNGLFSVSGRVKFLVDVEVSGSDYAMMLPCDMPVYDEVVSSRGTSHLVSPSEAPTIKQLSQERDTVDSYAALSSTSDHVAAVTIADRRETLRLGAEDKEAYEADSNFAFIELRSGGGMLKIYQRVFGPSTVPAGSTYRFGGTFWYGSIPGMRDTLTLT